MNYHNTLANKMLMFFFCFVEWCKYHWWPIQRVIFIQKLLSHVEWVLCLQNLGVIGFRLLAIQIVFSCYLIWEKIIWKITKNTSREWYTKPDHYLNFFDCWNKRCSLSSWKFKFISLMQSNDNVIVLDAWRIPLWMNSHANSQIKHQSISIQKVIL